MRAAGPEDAAKAGEAAKKSEHARISTFKKKGAPPGETKKLFGRFAGVWQRPSRAAGGGFWGHGRRPPRAKRRKSFLVLFFKKELL
jgi:hypothetical protein